VCGKPGSGEESGREEGKSAARVGGAQAVEKSFRPKDSEGRIVGKGTVRVPFP